MTFQFRAEKESDVDELRQILGEQVKKITKTIKYPFPNTYVEIDVNISLEQLRNAMRRVTDGLVMVQTVAPKDEYTGERNCLL